jgi:sugar/nucleoside kinase (ribokinase family)
VLTQRHEPVRIVIGFEHETQILSVDVPEIPKDEIVDDNGAGDSLAGGFLAALVKGLPIVSAVKEGI